MSSYEAMFWQAEGTTGALRCQLCGQRCLIEPGKRGVCRVRENQGGRLRPLAYGKLLALNPDPIEKKPLSHFQPGTRSLSIASAGCNLQCRWCQNHSMAQMVRREEDGSIRGRLVDPRAVVAEALELDCASIAYTYSEPTIHYEHNRAVGVEARAAGLKNVFVTNGMMTADVVKDAAESFLDGANVDLKAMSDETYRRHCKAGRRGLETVLEAIAALWTRGVWVEVTTLVIPGLNDGDDELRAAARFLRDLSADMPWHLSRYHPDNDWSHSPPTPIETLRRAREIGLEEGLRFVYTGNVWGDPGEHTYCPGCQAIVIRRQGYQASPVGMVGDGSGRCANCGAKIAGVEMP
jgi:pyruvate formate lyase activating enzyme